VSEALLSAGGIAGVLMVLVAYAGIHFDRLDPKKVPALLLNLFGSGLILLSMLHAFNLSAFLMEASWAAMAAFGLAKLTLARRN
jgi:K+ transporter